MTIKYTKWLLIEFGGVEQMENVYAGLERNRRSMIGVCNVDGTTCCAITRRTLPKKPIVMNGVGNIKGYYTVLHKSKNHVNMNDNIIKAFHA